MKIVRIILVIIIALLSLSAGAAKLMKVPQEVIFFESLGINLNMMWALGFFQVLAGVLIFVSKFRKIGAIFAALTFIISAIMILMTGQLGFGLFSLLPVILALYIAITSQNTQKVKNS